MTLPLQSLSVLEKKSLYNNDGINYSSVCVLCRGFAFIFRPYWNWEGNNFRNKLGITARKSTNIKYISYCRVLVANFAQIGAFKVTTHRKRFYWAPIPQTGSQH